jgi:uncharacterized membrane protein YhaH (DUF805 family)
MNWYAGIIKQYADFKGRSSRSEYWKFFLATLVISFGLSMVEGLFGGPGALALIFNIFVLIPAIAIGVRRMHDTDRSGWWLLVPIVGIVFLCQEGQPAPNRFGQNAPDANYATRTDDMNPVMQKRSSNPAAESIGTPAPLVDAGKMAGSVLKRAIATLPDGYYITHLGIGALFPMAILAAGQTGLTATFIVIATLNTLAYPFSRHFYDTYAHLVPVEQTVFVKIVAAICCWGLAVFIGPVGLAFAWHAQKAGTDKGT